jgi:Flp pilus assembly pilin Flp
MGKAIIRGSLKAMLRDESGLELSEYAVMARLIIAALVVTLGLLGGKIDAAFQTLLANI